EHRVTVEATSSDLTRLPPVDLGLPQYALTKRAEALLRLVRQHAYPHLAAEPVRLQDFADRDEGSAHPALAQVPGFAALAARASRVFPVPDGWAPFLIHASALSILMSSVGGSANGS